MSLPKPIDQRTQVLRNLLTRDFTSLEDYPAGFRLGSAIFKLKNQNNIDITTTRKDFKNQFGHPGSFAKYSLVYTSTSEKEKFIEKYLSLVKKEKESVA